MADAPAADLRVARRLDADALPWWLCVSAISTGLLLLVFWVFEGGHSHQSTSGPAISGGHAVGEHAQHVVMIIGTTLIMMSPFTFPLLRTVARTTLWNEAALGVAAAWSGFIGIWCLAGIAMHVVGELLAVSLTEVGAIAVLTVICVGAQLSRRRAALLNACQGTRPMRPGRPGRGGFAWGAAGARRCIPACAAPMTLMALSPALTVAAVIAPLLWWERFSTRRGKLRLPLALGYLLIGAGMLAAGPTG
jgi:hypothetical protein